MRGRETQRGVNTPARVFSADFSALARFIEQHTHASLQTAATFIILRPLARLNLLGSATFATRSTIIHPRKRGNETRVLAYRGKTGHVGSAIVKSTVYPAGQMEF